VGRHKLQKTPEEIVVQKRRWADSANAKRRERYARDSAYRRQAKVAARDYARSKSHTTPEGFTAKAAVCAVSLKRLKRQKGRNVTCSELATFLGMGNVVTLYTWQRTRRFPAPVETVIREGIGAVRVYTFGQAVRLLEVMLMHYQEKTYFFEKDNETITQLFDAMR